MKKYIGPAITAIGLLVASVAWFYLLRVWAGIKIHTPHCAPIGDTTVPIVFYFIGAGVMACLVAAVLCFRRRAWASVAIMALVLNLAALSTWGYWIKNEMLLPYDRFCDKVGMP